MTEAGSQSFLCFDVSDFGCHDLNEFFEVDEFFMDSEGLDDTIHEGTFAGLSEFFHDFVDFLWVDVAGVILIEEFEGEFEVEVVFRVNSLFPVDGCILFLAGGGWFLCDTGVSGSTHILSINKIISSFYSVGVITCIMLI